MVRTFKHTIAVLAAIVISLPYAAYAQSESVLGQAVELTGASLPQELRDFTGAGSGTSSWDYLSQKIAYGYYVEVYSNFDAIAQSKVDRRNGIEDLVGASYQTDYKANVAIADVKFNQDYTQRVMETEFAQRTGRGTQIANTYSMNTYIPHSDGSVEFFQDGLLARVNNQRSADEFGNVSFKNIYNFVYNPDRRLMLSHEYDTTDHLGNATHGTFSCSYTGDSIFYGTDTTNANKNYASYSVTETDHAGKVTTMDWTAGTYEGKYLRDFDQKTVTAIPGKDTGTTTLHRFNIQYSTPGQMTSYEEKGVANHIENEAGSDVEYTYILNRTNILYNARGEIISYEDARWDANPNAAAWNSDLSTWTKTTSTVTMEYLAAPHQFGADVDPDQSRIKTQTVTSRVENTDGSYSDSTTTTTYDYDAAYTLVGATGTTAYSGRASDWTSYTSTDAAGVEHQLSRTAKDDGTYEYSYVDPATNAVIVVAAATETTMDGNQYAGTSENTYAIVYGVPVLNTSHAKTQYLGSDNVSVVSATDTTTEYTYGLVNNMVKILSTVETGVTTMPTVDAAGEHPTTRTITTTYTYDANGYYDTVAGTGTETGWQYETNGFVYPYDSTITVTYEIKLDSPLVKTTEENKTYKSTESTN